MKGDAVYKYIYKIENEGEKMKEIVEKGCVNILEKGHENSTPPKKKWENC